MSVGSILPVVRYTDPTAAADWLCRAFGFSIHHVAGRPDGGTAYIVLRFGESSVLVAPHGSSAFDDLMVRPADVGNRSTQTCHLTVDDLNQHFAHAVTAGARIEANPGDDGIGGRFYMGRDPEGHLWSFGSPMVEPTAAGSNGPSPPTRRDPRSRGRAAIGLAVLAGVAVGCSAIIYAGLAPKELTAWIESSETTSTSAAKRLQDSEAAVADLTEKLRISELEFAEAQQLKSSAEKLLTAFETEYQGRLKDSQGALAAAVRAGEVAAQELEAERKRAQAIQTRLDEVSQQLAQMRADGNKFEVEARRLQEAMAQLGDALLNSTQAREAARGQLAANRGRR
jgi:uncharacterized glyoxalase superfamily protein PhnB